MFACNGEICKINNMIFWLYTYTFISRCRNCYWVCIIKLASANLTALGFDTDAGYHLSLVWSLIFFSTPLTASLFLDFSSHQPLLSLAMELLFFFPPSYFPLFFFPLRYSFILCWAYWRKKHIGSKDIEKKQRNYYPPDYSINFF